MHTHEIQIIELERAAKILATRRLGHTTRPDDWYENKTTHNQAKGRKIVKSSQRKAKENQQADQTSGTAEISKESKPKSEGNVRILIPSHMQRAQESEVTYRNEKQQQRIDTHRVKK